MRHHSKTKIKSGNTIQWNHQSSEDMERMPKIKIKIIMKKVEVLVVLSGDLGIHDLIAYNRY